LSGFKSFPERTVIEFDGGITGVIGPNGCGKSNILDSIRWVLGEQRTSVLRSSRMEQMIFSGTSSLKPTGMAEVTLLIKNNRGLLPVEYEDISITRRLYRSGESEYLLNKNACRLKDVIELFFDTGMGAHAYSVIQQGMIDSILSDKTEDRRSLFEEAAGVTKYKHRKKEAENKLAATEADLLRLGDVINEIEKQVVTLRRQAKRARRYAGQKNLLKEVECVLSAAKLYETSEEFDSLSDQKSSLQIQIASFTAEVDRLQAGQQEKKLRLTEYEKEAVEFRQRESDLTVEAASMESDIKLHQQRREVSADNIENNRKEIAALESRIETLKKKTEENTIQLQGLDSQKEFSDLDCRALEKELEDLAEKLQTAELSLEDKRNSHLEITGRISNARTEITYINETLKNLSDRVSSLDEEIRGYDRMRDKSSNDLSILERRREELVGRIEQLRKSAAIEREERDKLTRLFNESRETLSSLRAERSALEARRELFQQMIETGEGLTSGAAGLRSWKDKPSGILSALAEVLEVPRQHRVAVAAALGDMGEIIPVESYEDAYAAIDYLKSNSGGRTSFLVLSELNIPDSDIKKPSDAAGFLGYLDDIVVCPNEYRGVVKILLGRVALFETRRSAMDAGEDWKHITRVTSDGLAILPSGFISGGKTTTGVLGRRQDFGAVTERLEVVSSEIVLLENEISQKRKGLENLETSIDTLEGDIAILENEHATVGAEFNQLKFDFKEKENRYSRVISETDSVKAEINRLGQKNKSLTDEIQKLEGQAGEGMDETDKAVREVDEIRKTTRQVESGLTAARIRRVELDGLSDKLNSEIRHGEELRSEALKMIDANRDGIARAETDISDYRKAIENLKVSLDSCFERRNGVKEKLNKVNGEISELAIELSDVEEKIGRKRREKDELTAGLHSIDMRFMELDSARKSIMERLELEFGVRELEPAALPEDQTVESFADRAEKIRQTLKRMEPVNLMAAEDYERENDRLTFLVRQRDDLFEARTALKEAIIRINTTAENRFNKTFGLISENFQKVFVSLFEGGEARVELEDPSDPLESPIKISARPGGKKLLTVTQLSGGERALTAISLLFGIYLVKPSPFCVLDEVDAPLDDANLMRFLKLIKDFARDTQFIIITHNKLTMEASDILYGVTMQSPGVSKVVSVKFEGNGDGAGEPEHVEQARPGS
jgi:chromosome segregation protein